MGNFLRHSRFNGYAPRVVIIGGGFGGLTVARALRRAPVKVTVLDRTNYHLFQPLLYQVAMSGLSPGQIAQPIRSIVSKHANTLVLMAEAAKVDLDAQRVLLADGAALPFDYCVIAAGAVTNFFGNDQWSNYAFGLKTVEEALAIRRRVLLAFEAAEREPSAAVRQRLLTFVIIGGGPTGVELAGALAELSNTVLAQDFRNVNPKDARVVLLEMAPRILPPFSPVSAARAHRQLEELGVEVRPGTRVDRLDGEGAHIDGECIASSTVIWAAGVRPVEFAKQVGVPLQKGGIPVGADCSLHEYPNIFAIGDIAMQLDAHGKPLPGLAPVAMQQGRFVARTIQDDLAGRTRKVFQYRDKGMMATVGRSRAVLEAGRVQLSGFFAWMAWIVVHIWYLIGFRNRLVVLFDWFWSYFSYKRGARLITRDVESDEAPLGAFSRAELRRPMVQSDVGRNEHTQRQYERRDESWD